MLTALLFVPPNRRPRSSTVAAYNDAVDKHNAGENVTLPPVFKIGYERYSGRGSQKSLLLGSFQISQS